MYITSAQKLQLEKIKDRFQLELVVAYGSQIDGASRKDSDLDIAVLAKNRPDYELFKNLYGELSDIFKGVEVDIRFLNEADPLYMMQVVKKGLLLAGTQDDFDDLKIATNRRYIDDGLTYFPMQHELVLELQKRLQKLL